jgi:drug/metabolite transporter (DMT)-like permease
VLASLIAAVVAPLFYGVASAMQAVAVRVASRPAGAAAGGGAFAAVDPGLVPRMFRQWRFVASLGLDTLGFVAQLVALNRLPLFAVQAMVAANLAVTAVCASWLIGTTLGRREWLAVGGVIAGVALLGTSAGAQGAAEVGNTFKLALIVAVAGIGLIGLAVARLPGPARTPLLGATAGLGYGVLAVAARVLDGFEPAHLIKDPAAYALAAAGIVSFLFYAAALEGGSVTVAVAAVVLVETIPPAAVGITLLGDTTRPGMAGVAIAGFILAVICAVQLARFGQTEQPAAEGTAGGAVAAQPAGGDPHPASHC